MSRIGKYRLDGKSENEIEMKEIRNTIDEDLPDQDQKSKTIAIICTHNGRLKQIMRNFRSNLCSSKDVSDFIKHTSSFENCAIVHITSSQLRIYNKDENTYNFQNHLDISDLEIFLVRHGQGTHNLHKGIDKTKHFFEKDPMLTEEGINQAQSAGNKIKDKIKDIIQANSPIKYIFGASELTRTQQTVAEISKVVKPDNKDIYVLNCIYEIGNIPGTEFIPENTGTCSRIFNTVSNCKNVRNHTIAIPEVVVDDNPKKNVLYNEFNLHWLPLGKYNCKTETFQSILDEIGIVNKLDENKKITYKYNYKNIPNNYPGIQDSILASGLAGVIGVGAYNLSKLKKKSS